MPKQIENQSKGNRATRRLNGARLNRQSWEIQGQIALEIEPILAARQAAEDMAGMAGHYAPEADCPAWPRSKEFGEASEGGEVRQTCGHGYFPAHTAHDGAGRGGADMGAENSPILAAALAVADEKAVTMAHSGN